MKTDTKNYIIEVEKAINWEAGYLNYNGEIVTNIENAEQFDNKEDAENEAALFNMEYGASGKIYARVR